jgi:hypothetical protein
VHRKTHWRVGRPCGSKGKGLLTDIAKGAANTAIDHLLKGKGGKRKYHGGNGGTLYPSGCSISSIWVHLLNYKIK